MACVVFYFEQVVLLLYDCKRRYYSLLLMTGLTHACQALLPLLADVNAFFDILGGRRQECPGQRRYASLS
jgi:hypothetical protein